MKITKSSSEIVRAFGSSTTFNNSGGVLPSGTDTIQDAIDAMAAGLIGSYLTTTLGGQGVVQSLGSLGSTETIDLTNANYFAGTLNANCTISFTGWTNGKDCQITVELTEDGTGGWTPTFTGVTWIGGTPTWTTTLATVTVAVFFSRDGGTTIYGAVVGGGGLIVKDEGSSLATAATSLDFVGAGVVASGTGAGKTITIPGVGGGGGSSDVVLVASGAGSVVVPGMKGSPDAQPASPAATDDEFTALSGWTTLGTLDTSNVTDFPSNWHGKRACSADLNGIYKAIPGGGMPFTVTARITASYLPATNIPAVGIMLLDSTPTAIRSFDLTLASGLFFISMRRWTNRTTFATAVDTALSGIVTFGSSLSMYMKVLVTSSTSVSVSLSTNGYIYFPIAALTAISPTLTPAYVGLSVSDPSSTSSPEVVVDWIRFS